MFGFDYVTKHGRATSEQPELDAARRELSLCRHCKHMKPNQNDNCPMAEVLYALCRTKAMAVAVSRCEDFILARRPEV